MRRSSAILVVLLALSGCGSEDSESVRGTGYQFELPAGWEERTDDEALEDFDFAGYQFDTVATGEVEEGFATNVNVIVEGSVAPGVSTREYAEASERTLRNPGLIQGDAGQAVKRLNPREFSASRRLELGGEEAYASDYTGDQGGRVLRFRSIVAVRGGRAYAITYTALRHLFREHADGADQIVESWSWR